MKTAEEVAAIGLFSDNPVAVEAVRAALEERDLEIARVHADLVNSKVILDEAISVMECQFIAMRGLPQT